MTKVRLIIAPVLIAVSLLTGIKVGTAQVVLKPEDLMGTWELVSTKDLKTGEAILGMYDAHTGIQWMQFTRSHWMLLAMVLGRDVTHSSDLKTNYARVWNEKNDQIFMARGGTYSVRGDRIHQQPTIALYTEIIGKGFVLKVTRLDKSTMVTQMDWIQGPAITIESTFRRID